MARRIAWTTLMVFVGLALMVVSYFWWAAPWGFPPSNESFSNPRMDFAPALFVLGVILVFLAAVVYELLPDEGAGGRA